MTALRELLSSHFAERISLQDAAADGPVAGLLYDAVALELVEADGVVTGTLRGGYDELFPGVPAELVVPEADPAAALDQLDEWARMRLPEAYLVEWGAAKANPPARAPEIRRVGLDAPAAALHVLRFFGPRLTEVTPDSDGLGISGLLYGVLDFGAGLVGDEKLFTAAVLIDERYPVVDYLGREVSLGNDAASITASLEAVDRWARLRLPANHDFGNH